MTTIDPRDEEPDKHLKLPDVVAHMSELAKQVGRYWVVVHKLIEADGDRCLRGEHGDDLKRSCEMITEFAAIIARLVTTAQYTKDQ